MSQQYGSLINYVWTGYKQPEPEVGVGATLLLWTDRHAYTITKIYSERKIGVKRDKAISIGPSRYSSESQKYYYEYDNTSPEEIFTKRKNGAWKKMNTNHSVLIIGYRDEYYDPSF